MDGRNYSVQFCTDASPFGGSKLREWQINIEDCDTDAEAHQKFEEFNTKYRDGYSGELFSRQPYLVRTETISQREDQGGRTGFFQSELEDETIPA